MRRPRVIVADDSSKERTLVATMLSRLGANVEEFADPEAALRAYRRRPRFWHGAALDVWYPGASMDGLALANAMPGLPVLFVTGLGDRRNLELLKRRGEVLSKPFFPHEAQAVFLTFLDGLRR